MNVSTDFYDTCTCSCIEQACACEKDCGYQDYLVQEGFAMSCDSCGHAGSVASDGWIGIVDYQGRCAVYCGEKCAGKENYKIWESEQKDFDRLENRGKVNYERRPNL